MNGTINTFNEEKQNDWIINNRDIIQKQLREMKFNIKKKISSNKSSQQISDTPSHYPSENESSTIQDNTINDQNEYEQEEYTSEQENDDEQTVFTQQNTMNNTYNSETSFDFSKNTSIPQKERKIYTDVQDIKFLLHQIQQNNYALLADKHFFDKLFMLTKFFTDENQIRLQDLIENHLLKNQSIIPL